MTPETVKKAITGWIVIDTWHTGHALDMGRFYDFVTALCDERFMDEGPIRQTIHEEIEPHHPNFNRKERERLVDHFVHIAVHIYHFKVFREIKGVRGIGTSCWWCP